MRYFMGFLAFILIAILAVVLISRGGPNPQEGTRTGSPVMLSEISNSDTVVRITMDGRITAQEKHHAIRITVGRTSRTVEVLKGYNYEVEQTKVYDNNIEAYSAFLHAIDKAGYTRPKPNVTQSDEKGVCPTGTRYIYEVLDNATEEMRLWSTSCSANEGTFAGKAQLVRQLFRSQIPDYEAVTRGIRL